MNDDEVRERLEGMDFDQLIAKIEATAARQKANQFQ